MISWRCLIATPLERPKMEALNNSYSTLRSPRKWRNKPLRLLMLKMWYLLREIWILTQLIKVQFSLMDTNTRLPHRTKWTISPSITSRHRASSHKWLSTSFTSRINTPVETTAKKIQLAILDTLPALKRNQSRRRRHSTSQRVVGSAASARTTTSREEKSASDARKVRIKKTSRVSQNTCSRTRVIPNHTLKKVKRMPGLKISKRRPTPKTSTMRTPTSLLTSNRIRRELAIGSAKGASTTTSPSETCATSANAHKPRATKCFSRNNKI